MSSQGRTRIVIEHARGQVSSFTLTPLNSAVVPMTQWKKMKPMEKLSLHASLSSLIIFKGPPMSSMTSYIFKGRLRQFKLNPMGLLHVLSCESHKHISPSTMFVINTPKPTRGGILCTYRNPRGRNWFLLKVLLDSRTWWYRLYLFKRFVGSSCMDTQGRRKWCHAIRQQRLLSVEQSLDSANHFNPWRQLKEGSDENLNEALMPAQREKYISGA
jgi:hypothetical protein